MLDIYLVAVENCRQRGDMPVALSMLRLALAECYRTGELKSAAYILAALSYARRIGQ